MKKEKEKLKTEEKDLAIAVMEMREEESTPAFTEGTIKAFDTGYIDGMNEALSLLEEDRTKTDHLKNKG